MKKHHILSLTMSSLALLLAIIGACHAKEQQSQNSPAYASSNSPASSSNSPPNLSPESKYAIETNAIVPFKRHQKNGNKKQTLSVNDILYRKSQKARRKQNRRNKHHKHQHNKKGHNRRSRHHHKVEADRIFYKTGVSQIRMLNTLDKFNLNIYWPFMIT